ncbi:MAG TPA: protein kinase [Candidatus Polarisedimenticolia bacterium]|nr:protein kinase [Candidatus Polarisedimenticolia bacterium]
MNRTLQPEDRISHYRVVGPLGAGGMGEVYIARDETLERSVAMKVLPPHLVRNEERVRRFITEAKSASSLNHPNIVTIYEIGRDAVRSGQSGGEASQVSDPVHFISMELVTGETLSQKIHEEKADLKTLLGWLAQACEGVAKAHAAGIVHRDLKPGNVMISRDGFAKVLDFGLAKLTERRGADNEGLTSAETDAATGVGVVMGTVGYMSPEQVQARTVDARSDIFSMGCILYEAATRCRPFGADTNVETMHQILKDNPRPVEELNPQTPAAVRRLIRRCLAKSPDQRFQSMKDLAIELREIVDEYDSLSASATSSSSVAAAPLAAPKRTPAWLLLAIVAAVLVGAGGLAFGLYSLLGRGAQEGAAGLQELRISVLMSRDDLTEATLSADGRYLAYVTRADRTTSLTVRQVRTGSDVAILSGQTTPIQRISFSPDGDYLYYGSRDPNLPNYSALFQVASLGGSPRKVIFDVDSPAGFSPDGKRACFRRGLLDQDADSLVVTDLASGAERELTRIQNPDQFLAAPVWSPDGETIAIAIQSIAGGAKTRVVAVNAESGETSQVGTRTWLSADSLGWAPDGSAVFVSAFDPGAGAAPQIYRIGYPGGETVRMTHDLDGYVNISLPADGAAIAAVRRSTVNNLWVADVEAGREPESITFASGSASSIAAITPLPGGAVAFTAPQDDRVLLWRMAADGSDRRQLTSQGVFTFNPVWAPGAGIVFNRIESAEQALSHVWRIAPDGSGQKQLTTGNGEQIASLSPAGDTVLFTRWDRPRSLWIQRLDGGEPRALVEEGAVERALFSPDGERVLISKLEGAAGSMFPSRYILPVDGGEPLATFRLPAGATDIQWRPDGKAVTYVDRDRGFNVMSRLLPDGNAEPLTRFTDGQVADHRWHPDGSRILLHRRLNQRHSLWMLNAGRTEPSLITEVRTGETPLHEWAPDAPLLYFIHGNSSQDVVLITNFR